MSPPLQGLIIGFSIAAPVGPIGLLCIRRTLHHGRLAGLVSGLGAATADAFYGIVAGLGFTAVSQFLVDQQRWLQLGGGAFLVILGLATLRAPGRPPSAPGTTENPEPVTRPLLTAYLSIFALTLANPVTLLAFIGIFAGLGFGAPSAGIVTTGLLVAGVFAGSAAWWLILSCTAGWLGRRLDLGGLKLINFVSGAAIAMFGIWQILKLLG